MRHLYLKENRLSFSMKTFLIGMSILNLHYPLYGLALEYMAIHYTLSYRGFLFIYGLLKGHDLRPLSHDIYPYLFHDQDQTG